MNGWIVGGVLLLLGFMAYHWPERQKLVVKQKEREVGDYPAIMMKASWNKFQKGSVYPSYGKLKSVDGRCLFKVKLDKHYMYPEYVPEDICTVVGTNRSTFTSGTY